MQTRRIQRAVIIALGGAVVAALALPGVASAYQVIKSTNGVILAMESSDTTQPVTITRYYDYKPGDSQWSTSTSGFDQPLSHNAYNKNRAIAVFDAGAYSGDTIELDLEPGYRLQLIRVALTNSPFTRVASFALINDPMQVAVENTPTVNIGTQPAVSLSSSVSVAGTMPVDIQAVPEWFEGLAGLAAAVMGFAVVSFVWGWRTR